MKQKLLLALAVNTAANLAISAWFDRSVPRKVGLVEIPLVVFGPAPLYLWGSILYEQNQKTLQLRTS